MESRKSCIRAIVFWSIVLILYGFFVYMLFWAKSLFISALIFCLLFIMLNFLAIDLRKIKTRWLILWAVGVAGLLLLFIPNPIWQLMLVLILSVATIVTISRYLKTYFASASKISRFVYFMSAGYLFTVMTMIMYGFAIIGLNNKFPFKCQQIESWSEKVKSKFISSEQGSASLPLLKQEINSPQKLQTKKDLQGYRRLIKDDVIESFISTQKTINHQICEAIVGTLESVYQKPVFQVAIVFLIYLLFYGILRIVVAVLSFLGWGAFLLAKRAGLYKTRKVMKEVDEVF